jgi:ABC-type lipoprotein export system ATPase subunit
MNSNELVIDARDLWKSFDRGRIPVVQGVDVRVRAGELVALWGASGSGKSTLLHLLSGLDVPDRGTISILGRDATREKNRLHLRRHSLGFVFQLHNLIPDLSLEENLRIPAVAAHVGEKATRDRLEYLTDKIGLQHRLRHRVRELSGGERQRTAICRALMNRPKLIFADEPTGSLDEETGTVVFELLRQLVRDENVSVLIATHERRFVEGCDRVLRVTKGRVVPI